VSVCCLCAAYSSGQLAQPLVWHSHDVPGVFVPMLPTLRSLSCQVLTLCGHVVCRACLLSAAQYTGQLRCPVCRAEVDKNTIVCVVP
jgi:hypothetical protein